MLRKILGIVIILAVAWVLVSHWSKSVEIKKLKILKEPRIVTMADQRVIEIEMKGVPADISGKAISKLIKVYFSLKGIGNSRIVIRARWLKSFTVPQNEQEAIFAIPIPDTASRLPKNETKVKINTWEYGEVAEILHIGTYDNEMTDVERLLRFVKDSGYKIAGLHEEEYIKGPGILLKGNPNKYYTIIRYRVSKNKSKGKSKNSDINAAHRFGWEKL